MQKGDAKHTAFKLVFKQVSLARLNYLSFVMTKNSSENRPKLPVEILKAVFP
jgi:hypothetical protein